MNDILEDRVIAAQKKLTHGIMGFMTLLVVLNVGSLILGLVLLGTSANNSEVTKENTARLVDCTTPGGDCYENANRNNSASIRILTRVALASNYCSSTGPAKTQRELEKCMTGIIEGK